MTQLSKNKWIGATCVGWILGFVLVLILSGSLESFGLIVQFPVGVGMAAGVSLAQWWLLRKWGFGMSWAWYAIAGMGLPFIAVDVLQLEPPEPDQNYLIPAAAAGAFLLSVLQSFVVRRYDISPISWILSSCAGWWLATTAVFLVNLTMKSVENNWLAFFLNLALILAGGPLLGLLTAKPIMKASITARQPNDPQPKAP